MQLCASITSSNILVVNVDGTSDDPIDPAAVVDDFNLLENKYSFFFQYVAEYPSLDDGMFRYLSFPHQMIQSRIQ